MGMFDGIAEWLTKDPELDKKVALNSMVHRTLDRSGRSLTPMASDIKAGLLGDEDKRQAAEVFAQIQAHPSVMGHDLKRGWSPVDIENYRQKNDGRSPGPNVYAPGDVEYQKRLRGKELTEALLGPKTVTSHMTNASPTAGMGASHAVQVDPRDTAYERFQEDPTERSALQKGPDGTYANGETMNNLMDNQYNPIGSFLVGTGRAGEQSVANYFTHRDDGSGKGMSFLKGMGEMLYDTGAEFVGAEQSENGKKIENIQRAAEMSEMASPLVGNHLNDEERNAEAAEMSGMKDKLDYLNHAVSYKNAHGKNPHWLESAAMNTIPMLADWMGVIAPLTAVSKTGLKGVPKAALKASLIEAGSEDLPMMAPIAVGGQAMQDPLDMNQEEVKKVVADRNQAHKDFSNGTGQKIKERMKNFNGGREKHTLFGG